MAASSAPSWMLACGLPLAWQSQPSWGVLDTRFGDGKNFLALWQQWSSDPAGPRMLHVAALTGNAPAWAQLRSALLAQPGLASHAGELADQWFGLLPGFHRLVLHGGRLLLTLCVGPVQQTLRELAFSADSVLLSSGADAAHLTPQTATTEPAWDAWGAKALARVCRPGTRLSLQGLATDLPTAKALAQAGFTEPVAVSSDTTADGHAPGVEAGDLRGCEFRPRWPLKDSRASPNRIPVAASQIVVVGAGLAGAAAAEALARRGWQVDVIDAASQPANGASALPVGLLLPHVSRDDNPRSKLSRAGVRLTLQAARRHLVDGMDFDASGVAELAIDRERRLPDTWPVAGRQWSDDSLPTAVAAHLDRVGAPLDKAHWHATAGWIKPARLVQALLAQPGIRFQGQSTVQHVTWTNGHWQLYGSHGELLAQAPQLLIANAGDAPRLIAMAGLAMPGVRAIAPLTALRGQVSWAAHTASDSDLLPPFAVNGAGSVIARVPQDGGTAWFAGATYETADTPVASVEQAHAHNRSQMARLLPAAETAFTQALRTERLQAWQGTRWATADRLPLVGALHEADQPGLWLSSAMGSRGLTFAVLCAEVLAAQLCGEPAPLPKRLLRLIAADRAR